MAVAMLEILNDAVHIDASIVARGLGFEPSFVHTMMCEGEITSLCERGVDEDAGRYRLTFFHKSRRFRIIVDETGKVIQRSIIDFGDRLLPATSPCQLGAVHTRGAGSTG